MVDSVRVLLADKYDLVVGDTFQLYYNNIIEAPNPYIYSIVAICEKGKNFPRYFEYTPACEGQHKLTIQLYNSNHELIGEDETLLNVVAPCKITKPVNILCIGDSLTANGMWVTEVNRRISGQGGAPEGLNLQNVHFVGTCQKEGVGFEAFGGWTWDRFTSEKEGSMWIESPNNRTHEDQHSLWQDENGAIWQLETLQIDYLKFNRYQDHTSPRPVSGHLIHYKNAENTDPIPILSSSTEKSSPFFDPENHRIDFKAYAKRNQLESIDAAYIFLGTNGLMRQEAMTKSRREYCKVVVAEAKVLVDRLKEDFPYVKIKIMSPQLGSPNGANGFCYGAELPFTNAFDIKHYKFELRLAYQAWANEPYYRDFVEFVDVTAQFDAEYNYPYIEKPVNTRSNITERIDTNSCHPTDAGYMQIADAVYRNVVNEFCNK